MHVPKILISVTAQIVVNTEEEAVDYISSIIERRPALVQQLMKDGKMLMLTEHNGLNVEHHFRIYRNYFDHVPLPIQGSNYLEEG